MRRGSSHGPGCRVRAVSHSIFLLRRSPTPIIPRQVRRQRKASWCFGSQRPPIVSCSPSTSQPASVNPPLQGATSPSLLTGCTMACWAMFMGYLSSWLQEGAVSGLSLLQNLGVARLGNLINLGKNAGTLAQEMKQLREIEDDLVRQVELEEIRPRMKRTSQVNGWIQRVDELEDEVGTFQTSFEGRRTCLEGCSFDSVYANYELGQKAADLLGQVTGLKNQREAGLGGELVQLGPPEAVVAVPSTRIVGGEKIRSEIRSHLQHDEVRLIGIYGMGGVGKTTYLAEINNDFHLGAHSNDFEVVIWVTVTKDVDIRRIQEDISVRLGFSRKQEPGSSLPTNEADRRNALCQALSRKKFLLLLDDVWEKLELNKIGIPLSPQNQTKAKVVFTTRLKQTCVDMEAQKMVKVDFLDADDSWNLFCLKVGEKVGLDRNKSLQPLAKRVVRRCGGLPLALVTMGLAMTGAETIGKWEDALARLREAAQDVQNMGKEVLSVLKFSFDKLKDDSLRHCLLYCALYPEDHVISTRELIEYWIGEGFLDPKYITSLDRARRKGREVVRSLEYACLLESVGSQMGVDYVKMHDVVRDMALWLTSGEQEDETDVFVVNQSGEGSYRLPSSDRWERSKRISLMTRESENVEWPDPAPKCSKLQTLLIRGTAATAFRSLLDDPSVVLDGSIFKFMPALRVLDLSFTTIQELPAEIGLLVELRYLGLQRTLIKSLPKELGKLVRLRQLNLKGTDHLQSIPAEAILRLGELQLLNLFLSRYNVTWEYPSETNVDYEKEITLKGIESHLCRLEELGVSLDTTKSLEGLMNSNRLSKCTRYLKLYRVSDLRASDLSMALERLQGLRELFLFYCRGLEELRFGGGIQLQSLEVLSLWGFQTRILTAPPGILQRLRLLHIHDADSLKELTWTRYLPSLERIHLADCRMLEELVRADGQGSEACGASTEDNSFPNLKKMTLLLLPSLKTISEHPLLLPSLETLLVNGCPGLKKLPLGAHSGKMLRAIEGTQEWWDQLEWDEDSGVKGIFISRFHSLRK